MINPNMAITFSAALCIVSIFLSPSSSGQFIEPRLCDGVCYCSRNEAVVDCSPQDRITGVPTNLPQGTQKLVIQGGFFPHPGHLSAKNLTGLTHLVSLRIVNSQLRSIESRAFLGMTNLRDLDLSLNLLYRIESHTFYGLNLKTLYLQKQRLQPDHYTLYGPSASPEALVTSAEAFYGLSALKIDLHHNFISDVSFSLFSKVDSLEKLILSDNRIHRLDPRFANYFDKSNRLLDLTDNPLECSCKLAWLANRVKEWVVQLPSLKITCITEKRSGGPGLELNKLTANHLCMASRIQTIGVDIAPAWKVATLSCTAVAFNVVDTGDEQRLRYHYGDREPYTNRPAVQLRPPSVAWKHVESGQLRQVTGMPRDSRHNYDSTYDARELAMTTVQLNVSLSKINREFACITWDDKEDNQEVLVTLRGPMLPSFAESKDTSKVSAFGIVNYRSPHPDEQLMAFAHSNSLFQKQYTLLEMIGAVIGTFSVTLVVLLVGSRCMMLLKNRAISNHPSKEISRQPTTYSALASRQSDAHGVVGSTASRIAGNNGNGCIQTATTYPLYNHYLASASGITYPTLIPPTASLTTNPNAATPLLQAGMTVPGLQGMQPITQWPAPPGSTYSGAGSHEYDIPRAMELSQAASDQAIFQRGYQQQQMQAMPNLHLHHCHQQQQPQLSHTMEAFGGDGAD